MNWKRKAPDTSTGSVTGGAGGSTGSPTSSVTGGEMVLTDFSICIWRKTVITLSIAFLLFLYGRKAIDGIIVNSICKTPNITIK
jgi:hypothetical protein